MNSTGLKVLGEGEWKVSVGAERTLERGGSGEHAETAGEPQGLAGKVAAAVVAEPLDGIGRAVDEAEPALDGLDHHVPDALGGDTATQVIAPRSQQSRVNATQTRSPLCAKRSRSRPSTSECCGHRRPYDRRGGAPPRLRGGSGGDCGPS